jgi:hypothetical protein
VIVDEIVVCDRQAGSKEVGDAASGGHEPAGLIAGESGVVQSQD